MPLSVSVHEKILSLFRQIVCSYFPKSFDVTAQSDNLFSFHICKSTYHPILLNAALESLLDHLMDHHRCSLFYFPSAFTDTVLARHHEAHSINLCRSLAHPQG
jgi:hypothetical protein